MVTEISQVPSFPPKELNNAKAEPKEANVETESCLGFGNERKRSVKGKE